MHPQSDFDADLRRLRQIERPDSVSGLLNSMHFTDTSARMRPGSRLVGSAERSIAAVLTLARRGGRFASQLASARKAHVQFHQEAVIRDGPATGKIG